MRMTGGAANFFAGVPSPSDLAQHAARLWLDGKSASEPVNNFQPINQDIAGQMAQDQNSGEEQGTAPEGADQDKAPVFQLLSQYVKDLSFENPNAPASVMSIAGSPSFDVKVNVQVKRAADDVYAVELTLLAKANSNEQVLFDIELVYGGAFRAQNVPDQQLPPLLMIEAPRLLFPFARQVLANASQAGGFPPLMMEPVDFAALYQRNLENMSQAQTDGAPN